MNFKITIVDVNGKPLLLGDDDNGWKVSIPDGMPEQTRQKQTTPLFRAKSQEIFDRYNRLEQFAFNVDRVFASLPLALAHKYFHANKVPNYGTLIVQTTGFKATLSECFIEPRCRKFDALSVLFEYHCTGKEWS